MSQEMAGQEGGPRRKVNVKQKRWQEDAERFPGSLPCPSEGGRVAWTGKFKEQKKTLSV